MKRMISAIAALTTVLSMVSCGNNDTSSVTEKGSSSSSDETSTEVTTSADAETTTKAEEPVKLIDVTNWLTSDIWNDGFCDLSWYVETGKGSTGQDVDVDKIISNLKESMKSKDKYDKFIKSQSNDELIKAWEDTMAELEPLYKQICAEKPANDGKYVLNADNFKEAYLKFYDLACNLNDTVTTKENATTTKATTESTTNNTTKISKTAEEKAVSSAKEYAEAIAKKVSITEITEMEYDMIGAVDGIGFMCGDNEFEIYDFSNDKSKLDSAKSGTLTYSLEGFEGFGDLSATSSATVNGKYVLLYDTPDENVISAFKSVKL